MSVMEFNTDNFEKEVINSDIPVVVDFFATWCGPCSAYAPVLHEIADHMGDTVKFGKLDIDQSMDLALEYKIMSVPTIAVFKNGALTAKKVGGPTESELKEMLAK